MVNNTFGALKRLSILPETEAVACWLAYSSDLTSCSASQLRDHRSVNHDSSLLHSELLNQRQGGYSNKPDPSASLSGTENDSAPLDRERPGWLSVVVHLSGLSKVEDDVQKSRTFKDLFSNPLWCDFRVSSSCSPCAKWNRCFPRYMLWSSLESILWIEF